MTTTVGCCGYQPWCYVYVTEAACVCQNIITLINIKMTWYQCMLLYKDKRDQCLQACVLDKIFIITQASQ